MTKEYRQRIYQRYFSAAYSAINPATDEGYEISNRFYRRLVLPLLPASRTTRILDAASGIGYLVETLRNAGYSSVDAIDISPEQVEIARQRGISVEQADALTYLAGVKSVYDVILALDFIEHLDRNEILRFLDLCMQALRPGGRIIVKTPNANSPLASRSRFRDLTHELCFTEQSLSEAFLACGLKIIHIGGEPTRPWTFAGWVRWVVAKVIRTAWKTYLVAELGREALTIPTEYNLMGIAERPKA